MGALPPPSLYFPLFLIFSLLLPPTLPRILSKETPDSRDSPSEDPFHDFQEDLFRDSIHLDPNPKQPSLLAPLSRLDEESYIEPDSKLHFKSGDSGASGRWTPAFFFENLLFILLICAGGVLALTGKHLPTLSLSILAFISSYYLILFASTLLDVYQTHNISHQIALFFGTIFLSFVVAISSFFFQSCRHLILALACASTLCTFLLDFSLDVLSNSNKLIFLAVYLGLTFFLFIITNCFPAFGLLMVSATTGAGVMVINGAVLSEYVMSFESFKLVPEDATDSVAYVGIAWAVGIVLGLLVQVVTSRLKGKSRKAGSTDQGRLEKMAVR